MLRACRRLLRPGGRLAFYTIFIPQGLSEADYRRATRAAGPSVTSRRREQRDLLRSAGFAEVAETDVTDEFLRITRALLEARERHAPELRESEGESEFARNHTWRRARVAAIEGGLLRRSLFVAERPR